MGDHRKKRDEREKFATAAGGGKNRLSAGRQEAAAYVAPITLRGMEDAAGVQATPSGPKASVVVADSLYDDQSRLPTLPPVLIRTEEDERRAIDEVLGRDSRSQADKRRALFKKVVPALAAVGICSLLVVLSLRQGAPPPKPKEVSSRQVPSSKAQGDLPPSQPRGSLPTEKRNAQSQRPNEEEPAREAANEEGSSALPQRAAAPSAPSAKKSPSHQKEGAPSSHPAPSAPSAAAPPPSQSPSQSEENDLWLE